MTGRRGSTFRGTGLLDALAALLVDEVIARGLPTGYSVASTLRHARTLELPATLAGDADSTFDNRALPADQIIAHHNGIHASRAKVLSTDEVAGAISGQSDARIEPTPRARPIPMRRSGAPARHRSRCLQALRRRAHPARRGPPGRRRLRAVDVVLAEIARMPERCPVARGRARRAPHREFPKTLFLFARPDLVSVVFCPHTRRDPRRWQERGETDRRRARQLGAAGGRGGNLEPRHAKVTHSVPAGTHASRPSPFLKGAPWPST